MRLKLLLILVAIALCGTVANAQSSSSVIVNTNPPYPSPGENTTVVLNSYVYNLDTVSISWFLNGVASSSGIGKKTFSVNAPEAGKKTDVSARLVLPDGIAEIKVSIAPSVITLLWQANDSYVPPFYRGKALPTPDSEVKVVAMPEVRNAGVVVSPQNMTYSWKKDYTNNVDGSGYGKNFFTYINDYLEDSNNVSVVATTVDQKTSTSASVDIGMTEPKIVFYKNDSNLGTMWQNALSLQHRIQEKGIIEATPYFISPKELQTPSLIWSWFINDSRVSLTENKKNLIPLSAEAGVHGTSKLRLEIGNREKVFQTTNKEIDVVF